MKKDQSNLLLSINKVMLIVMLILNPISIILSFFDYSLNLSYSLVLFILTIIFVFINFKKASDFSDLPDLKTINCYLKITEDRYMAWEMNNSYSRLFIAHLINIEKQSKTTKELNKSVKDLIKQFQINNQALKEEFDYVLISNIISYQIMYIDVDKKIYLATSHVFRKSIGQKDNNEVVNVYTKGTSVFKKLKIFWKTSGKNPLDPKDMGVDFTFYKSGSIAALLKFNKNLILNDVIFSDEEKKIWLNACFSFIKNKGESWGSFNSREEILTSSQKKAMDKCKWFVENMRSWASFSIINKENKVVNIFKRKVL